MVETLIILNKLKFEISVITNMLNYYKYTIKKCLSLFRQPRGSSAFYSKLDCRFNGIVEIILPQKSLPCRD